MICKIFTLSFSIQLLVLSFTLAQVHGELDPDFGDKGIWKSDPFTQHFKKAHINSFLQEDGHLLVIESFLQENDAYLGFKLTRIKPNGKIDSTFGQNGTFQYDIPGNAISVVSNKNGKIYLGGTYAKQKNDTDLYIIGLTRKGKMDLSFGEAGKVQINLGGNDILKKIQIDNEGKILLAGETKLNGSIRKRWVFIRLQADGNWDKEFGHEGICDVYVGKYPALMDIAIGDQGEIVGVGYARESELRDVVIVKFLNQGILDTTFNHSGINRIHVGKEHDYGIAVVVRADQKILVGGHAKMEGGTDFDLVVLSLLPNGLLDPNFGNHGVHYIDQGRMEYLSDIFLMKDDNLLLTGYTNGYTQLARVLPSGYMDLSFGMGGIVNFEEQQDLGGSKHDQPFDIHVNAKNSILITSLLNNSSAIVCMKGNPYLLGLDALMDRDWNIPPTEQAHFTKINPLGSITFESWYYKCDETNVQAAWASSENLDVFLGVLNQMPPLSFCKNPYQDLDQIIGYLYLKLNEKLAIHILEDHRENLHVYLNGRYKNTFERGPYDWTLLPHFP